MKVRELDKTNQENLHCSKSGHLHCQSLHLPTTELCGNSRAHVAHPPYSIVIYRAAEYRLRAFR